MRNEDKRKKRGRASELRNKKREKMLNGTCNEILTSREVSKNNYRKTTIAAWFRSSEWNVANRQSDEIGARTHVQRVVVNGAHLPL